ncbi:MAG: hypothetical protein NDP13_00555 [Crenarchaeota archaeon]|nr:hypothetical protein [Thermoproteota archaeon]MCR8453475.1 hypothetical protein [Thermoproteota archaeon]MCR8462766.1 hypothetical protein [Thermoproteota archaeon]MCR8470539.1 hypothetical protein [Thermoproteota archaeon]MCR8471534.1 hypothetical protein [Thermoproteota archaeon]
MKGKKFNTETDARILMAIAMLEKLDELTKMGKVPGIKKDEAMQILERLTSTLNKIRESRMSKHELIFSGLFRAYNQLLSTYVSAMGTKWFQIAKNRDDYTAKLLRFALLNLRSLGSRIKKTEDSSLLSAFNILFVRVIDKKPLRWAKEMYVYECTDLESVYEVASSLEISKGEVVAFAHTPPIKVNHFYSEGIFVRGPDGKILVGSSEHVGGRVESLEIFEEDRRRLEEIVLDYIEDYMQL